MRVFPGASVVALALLLAGSCSGDGETEEVVDLTSSTTTSSVPPASSSTMAPSSSSSSSSSSSTTTTTTTTTTTSMPVRPLTTWTLPAAPVDGTPPPLLIGAGSTVVVLEPGPDGRFDGPFDSVELFTAAGQVGDLHMAGDGTVFIEEHYGDDDGNEYWPGVVAYRPDGSVDLVAPAIWLHDVSRIDGVDSVIVSIIPAEGPGLGGLYAYSIGDPSELVAELVPVSTGDGEIRHADFAGGFGVATLRSEEGPWLLYVGTGGAGEDVPPALAERDFDVVPVVALSADGSEIVWAEGPGWGDGGPLPWVVRGFDTATGEELVRSTISEPVASIDELNIHSIHHLGTHLIINRTTVDGDEIVALPALIFDTTASDPALYPLLVPGIAAPAVTTEG